jgi:hypothetical protein
MEKKYYSFFNTNKCIGSNGGEYVGVTTQVTVSNFKDKVVGDTVLVSGRAPITNRAGIISSVLGKEFTPDENGNIWVNVNFWGDKAEQFKKFLNGREKVRLVVVGSLTYREFTRNDGEPGLDVSIRVLDWLATEPRTKEN